VNILLAFYGDDFTGTVSTAEMLKRMGVPTVVFTEPPSLSHLEEHFPDLKAVGVAGRARTWSPDEMDELLAPILEKMKAYRAPVFIYKVCSTFDSSPLVGSIGRAIEIGMTLFSTDLVPVLPAAPEMRRMTVFGNHFAAAEDGQIHRLDRHHSMANHPVTPMRESDLLLHLAQQTDLPSGLVDVLSLEKGPDGVNSALDELKEVSVSIALLDCLFDRHVRVASSVLWNRSSSGEPIFVVGSHELGAGFGRVFKEAGLVPTSRHRMDTRPATDKGPLLAVSGSCSSLTRHQILLAVESGFVNVAVNVQLLLDPGASTEEESRIVKACQKAIHRGDSAIVHTCLGPADPRIAELKARSAEISLPSHEVNRALGDALGKIAREVLRRTDLKRLAIAGGDTSGRVQKQLSIEALEIVDTYDEGPPLCYVYSNDSAVNGIEVAFKGGQVGDVDYFSRTRTTRTFDFETAALGRAQEETHVIK